MRCTMRRIRNVPCSVSQRQSQFKALQIASAANHLTRQQLPATVIQKLQQQQADQKKLKRSSFWLSNFRLAVSHLSRILTHCVGNLLTRSRKRQHEADGGRGDMRRLGRRTTAQLGSPRLASKTRLVFILPWQFLLFSQLPWHNLIQFLLHLLEFV